MSPLSGMVVPLVTPFDASLKVDSGALRDLCERVIQAGADALFPLGTSGEFLSLDSRERKYVAGIVAKAGEGRVPVIVHVGCFRPGDTIDLALHAAELGASGVAAVTPYYFKLSAEELERYYVEVCSALPEDFPVYIYAIPSHAGNSLPVDVLERLLARCPNLVGLKFSSSDVVMLQEYARLCRPGGEPIVCLVGFDEMILASVAAGARGAVSGHANAVPALLRGLLDAAFRQQAEEARRLQATVTRVSSAFRQGNVARLKAYLRGEGVGPMRVRPPLVDLTPEETRALCESVERILSTDSQDVGLRRVHLD